MAYAADKITVNGIQLGQLEKMDIVSEAGEHGKLTLCGRARGGNPVWYYRRGKHIHLCGADVDFFGNHNKSKNIWCG